MKIQGWIHKLYVVFLAFVITGITSCHIVHPVYPTSGQQMQSTLDQSIGIDEKLIHRRPVVYHRRSRIKIPDKVNASLMPSLSNYVRPTHYENPRFDVVANNTPVREFFMGLVNNTPYNMVVSPALTGTITLNLKNVTIKQTLEAVHDIYGYEFHRTSYGYEVALPQLETRLFHINYLDVQRNGRSYMTLTTGQVSSKVGTTNAGGSQNYFNSVVPNETGEANTGQGTISSVETKSEMHFWKDLEKTITGMVGSGGGRSVTINAQSGVIVIKAFPKELNRIARYIGSIQRSLNRQVILEAKILEVQLDKNYEAGIDWGILSNAAIPGSTKAGIGQFANQIFGTEEANNTLNTFNGIFTWRVNGDFSLIINLLQAQGNVQILSSPHISTVNNQKAVIKVGSDEFFVTGVSTTNAVVGTNTLPSQDVSLTPFFSGITLDVTPEISDEKTVILHIHPSVSKVTEQTKEVGLGTSGGTNNTLTLPLAFSTIRESDNIVRAKNGQVIVIGGLMQNTMSEIIAATPGVTNIPFFGSLFRRTKQQATKSELVILLRPIIVTNKTVITKLQEEGNNLQMLQRPYHVGGFPLVFGNEAERTCTD